MSLQFINYNASDEPYSGIDKVLFASNGITLPNAVSEFKRKGLRLASVQDVMRQRVFNEKSKNLGTWKKSTIITGDAVLISPDKKNIKIDLNSEALSEIDLESKLYPRIRNETKNAVLQLPRDYYKSIMSPEFKLADIIRDMSKMPFGHPVANPFLNQLVRNNDLLIEYQELVCGNLSDRVRQNRYIVDLFYSSWNLNTREFQTGYGTSLPDGDASCYLVPMMMVASNNTYRNFSNGGFSFSIPDFNELGNSILVGLPKN